MGDFQGQQVNLPEGNCSMKILVEPLTGGEKALRHDVCLASRVEQPQDSPR